VLVANAYHNLQFPYSYKHLIQSHFSPNNDKELSYSSKINIIHFFLHASK